MVKSKIFFVFVFLSTLSLVTSFVQAAQVVEIENQSFQELRLFLPADEERQPIILEKAFDSYTSMCADIRLAKLYATQADAVGGIRLPGLQTSRHLYLLLLNKQEMDDGSVKHIIRVYDCPTRKKNERLLLTQLKPVCMLKEDKDEFSIIIGENGAIRPVKKLIKKPR